MCRAFSQSGYTPFSLYNYLINIENTKDWLPIPKQNPPPYETGKVCDHVCFIPVGYLFTTRLKLNYFDAVLVSSALDNITKWLIQYEEKL
jgi:hypothetical protein